MPAKPWDAPVFLLFHWVEVRAAFWVSVTGNWSPQFNSSKLKIFPHVFRDAVFIEVNNSTCCSRAILVAYTHSEVLMIHQQSTDYQLSLHLTTVTILVYSDFRCCSWVSWHMQSSLCHHLSLRFWSRIQTRTWKCRHVNAAFFCEVGACAGYIKFVGIQSRIILDWEWHQFRWSETNFFRQLMFDFSAFLFIGRENCTKREKNSEQQCAFTSPGCVKFSAKTRLTALCEEAGWWGNGAFVHAGPSCRFHLNFGGKQMGR